ncbi:baseplate J/gp47 family protein [Sphingomonas sp. QA11]|uniref:baseplate assembly protein n=1 Tax=Sphingomonas sp. QA11 TaxID=2950605 RepID=UPI00234A7CE7|nr:baseplate J/gp47 family protein [Sphingomonas sp. QA11]WCM29193.1 baseplate J/gp47 family protein [Sphingomonas sp. QA11]
MPEYANTTTAIDLSRLPAPSFLAVPAYETILAEIIAYLQSPEILPEFDATVDSDPAVKIVQVLAYRELLRIKAFNDDALKVMLAYSTGADLEQIGARLNVARLVLDPGNPANGIDPTYESDDALRLRIQLAPESFTVAGPEAAYRFHAMSADATIRDVSATSPQPGQVLITLLSRLGDGTADADQIDAVADMLGVVSGNRRRPLGDQVIVQSADIVEYQIEARLRLYSGPDEVLVLAASQLAVNAWLADSGMLGVDATRALINAAVVVPGVMNVELVHPPADVVVDRTQSAKCVGVQISVIGLGE